MTLTGMDYAGTVVHVHNAETSSGPTESYT